MRCHPYLLDEINAAAKPEGGGEEEFDEALMGHMGYATINAARAVVFGLVVRLPGAVADRAGRHRQVLP